LTINCCRFPFKSGIHLPEDTASQPSAGCRTHPSPAVSRTTLTYVPIPKISGDSTVIIPPPVFIVRRKKERDGKKTIKPNKTKQNMKKKKKEENKKE